MRRALAFVLLLLAVGPALDAAVQLPGMRAGGGHRYLFLIDTSAPLAAYAGPTREIIGELIRSGMQGQMLPGDEYAIWPYDERLYTDQFRTEIWVPEFKGDLATAAGEFVANRRYQGQPMLHFPLVEMLKVIKASRSVTVVFINNGIEPLRGTPFDGYANAVYREHGQRLRKERKPFVTALLAVEGRIIACAVSAHGSEIQIPPLPARLAKVAEPEPPTPAEPPKPAARPKREPLILIGPKPAPIASAPVSMASPATNVAGTAASPPAPAPPSGAVSPPEASIDASAQPSGNSSVAATTPVASLPVPAAATSNPQPKPPAPPAPVARAETPAAPARGAGPAARHEPPAIEVVSPPVKAPPLAAVSKADPATTAPPPPHPVVPPAALTVAPPAIAHPAPPLAAAGPARTALERHFLLIVAGILAATTAGLILLFLRSSRSARKPSLISRSMGLHGK